MSRVKSWLRLNCRCTLAMLYTFLQLLDVNERTKNCCKVATFTQTDGWFFSSCLFFWCAYCSLIFCVRFDWKNLSEIIITLKFMAVFVSKHRNSTSFFFVCKLLFCPLRNRDSFTAFFFVVSSLHASVNFFIRFCII